MLPEVEFFKRELKIGYQDSDITEVLKKSRENRDLNPLICDAVFALVRMKAPRRITFWGYIDKAILLAQDN